MQLTWFPSRGERPSMTSVPIIRRFLYSSGGNWKAKNLSSSRENRLITLLLLLRLLYSNRVRGALFTVSVCSNGMLTLPSAISVPLMEIILL